MLNCVAEKRSVIPNSETVVTVHVHDIFHRNVQSVGRVLYFVSLSLFLSMFPR